MWVLAFVEPRKATLRPGPLQALRSRKSRSAPSVPGGPAPAPLRTQAEHRVAHHPAPHPFAGQLRKDLPASGGLSTALTYLGAPLPRTLRSAQASLAPLPPPSSPSPASRGPCIPGPVPLTSAVEKPAGLRASAPLWARLRAAWRGHCAPQRPREGATRGKRRPDTAPRPHLPAPAKNIPAPAANRRNAPSGAERRFPACCSLGGDAEASWKERGPLLSSRPRAPGGAGWGPPEQLCTPPLSARLPPETPPYP